MSQETEPSGRRGFFGWTKNESLVALVTVIIATVGVTVSSVSTFLTYQQVRVLNQERMTPYRAILYSSKLDSFTQVSAEFYDYQVVQTEALNQYANTLVLSKEFTRKYVMLKELAQSSGRVLNEQGKLSATLYKEEVIWPLSIEQGLENIRNVSSQISGCFVTIKAVTYSRPPQIVFDILSAKCSYNRLAPLAHNLEIAISDSQQNMRKEIRAERLQWIDPQN